jgi:hypothetical protein
MDAVDVTTIETSDIDPVSARQSDVQVTNLDIKGAPRGTCQLAKDRDTVAVLRVRVPDSVIVVGPAHSQCCLATDTDDRHVPDGIRSGKPGLEL